MKAFRSSPDWLDLVALGMLAGSGLTFQILLLRLFTLTQWHHFAALAISVALLGLGAAGTVLTLLGTRVRTWGDRLFLGAVVGAGVGMLVVLVVSQRLTVRPLFAFQDLRQLLKLILLDFIAFIPFFMAALGMGQVFVRWPKATRRLYAANLLGSGAGSLAALGLLALLSLVQALVVVAATLLTLGAVSALLRRAHKAWAIVPMLVVAAAGGWLGLRPQSEPRISDFKPLAYLLDLPELEIIERRHSIEGLVTVAQAPSLRYAPGLSLTWWQVVPPAKVVALGADRIVPYVPRDDPSGLLQSDHWKAGLGALPHLLRSEADTLVLGAGEWMSAAGAVALGGHVEGWLEASRAVSGALQRHAQAPVPEAGHPRRGLERAEDTCDLIVFEVSGEPGDALGQTPLLTVEAFEAAMGQLAEDGMLVLPLTLQNPPRHLGRLLATLNVALGQRGVSVPGDHVAVLRSMSHGLVLVGRQAWSVGELVSIRGFAERLQFDLVWLPGMGLEEANRFHRLEEAFYAQSARAVFEGAEWPVSTRFYHQQVSTDRRPYLWHSVRWGALPELFERAGRQGLVMVDWAPLMLVVSLVLALILAVVLIIAPLGRVPASRGRRTRVRVVLYFGGLGLGFLILEMAALERVTLLVGEPITAAAMVFTLFLVGSGVGSASAPQRGTRRACLAVFGPLAVGLLIAAVGLMGGLEHLWGLSAASAGGLALLMLIPLAWSLGRPLPWGLRRMRGHARWIAWAWGINGFASVIAAPLAMLAAVEVGHGMIWLLGAAMYAVAAVVGWSWSVRGR